ncbi:DUF4855 domain-containing protein [Alicyclobacillus fastidiosus]|uniref:DUF4855 domain-containing protein n=1 Tax=Alicyclobacillus fastidiosus TaxID=392011 RepID=A0ABY6ZFT2_9BACL|nr:DUF4855 domain-containing protein [Alicyclobacillus fastidiosus]WAH41768.1 DUF4855 domain-containing protein [Alicyclobacillus fastidiosus]GMA63461.1 hypothetical protein GCM10025859_39010 [Alicyclobacillus fastidiosus]
MDKRHLMWLMTTLTFVALGMVPAMPRVLADAVDPAATQQDLTNLGTVSTTVTGLADSVFEEDEQKYQHYALTDDFNWTGFCHQGGRDVTIQFPNPVDVQHVEITMEQNAAQGIYYPSDVQFEAYSNGQWYSLATQPTSIPESDDTNTTQVFQFNSSAGIETDEIRLSFPVNLFVFARGLDIAGSTTSVGALPTSLVVPAQSTSVGALTPNALNAHGIANMLLVPTGSYGPLGTWSEGDFVPMLEYINPSGQAVAPLFDTMLFSPYANVPDTVDGWTAYLNDLFQPGQQLSALNGAVALANESLNRPGYKEKVVLSIPYFPYGAVNFGSVDGQLLDFDGTAADPDALNARDAAMSWYVNTLLNEWRSANYQNLELVGLYWDHEQFNPGLPGEQQIFEQAQMLAHSNGLPLFWIPFYGANGTSQWQTLGLDTAWLQPNYIEQGAGANINRISNAEKIATHNGMGIEVELTALDATTESLYQTFLNELSNDGFGSNNVSHAYYDGSKLLLDAEQSANPAERQVYDETAAFMLH